MSPGTVSLVLHFRRLTRMIYFFISFDSGFELEAEEERITFLAA